MTINEDNIRDTIFISTKLKFLDNCNSAFDKFKLSFYKKKMLSIVSADRRLRSLDTRTAHNIRKVVDQMHEPICKFPVFFFFVCFFLPTIRIRKKYSNVNGIEEYSTIVTKLYYLYT
jgi:hypothetical protein